MVCICSDHGFGGAGDYALYLNQFLISKGWLTLKSGQESRLGKVMDWSPEGRAQSDTFQIAGAYLEHCHLG